MWRYDRFQVYPQTPSWSEQAPEWDPYLLQDKKAALIESVVLVFSSVYLVLKILKL